MKLGKSAAIFLGLVLILSGFYFVYAYFTLPPTKEADGFFGELGEGVGSFAIWGLVLLYCRGLLKLLANEGPWLQRFLPQEYSEMTQSLGLRFLQLLNRSHPALGILTIALLAGHAGLTSSNNMNLFLVLTMVVVFWQGGFGLFLKTRLTPLSLRKYTYAVHAQLVSGGLILIFAGFGHLLVGD